MSSGKGLPILTQFLLRKELRGAYFLGGRLGGMQLERGRLCCMMWLLWSMLEPVAGELMPLLHQE